MLGVATVTRKSSVTLLVVTLTQANSAIAIDGRPLDLQPSATRATAVAGTRDLGPPEGARAPAQSFDLVLDPGPHVVVIAHDQHALSGAL